MTSLADGKWPNSLKCSQSRLCATYVSWPECPRLSKARTRRHITAYIFGKAQSPRTTSVAGDTPSHACPPTWRRATSASRTCLALCPRLTCMGFFSPCTTPRCSMALTTAWLYRCLRRLRWLVYLKQHFKFPLPTNEVCNALPQRGKKTGADALLEGAFALPPEALQALCD